MLENKWKHGKVHFKLPELPAMFLASPGIKLISVVIDNHVGKEIVLLITESVNQIEEFEGREISRFMLKAGLVNTSYGLVCFFLYYFPNPLTGRQVTYENTVNPKDCQQLSLYEQLSVQKYWHVVLADDSGKVVNFFEFPNEYGLNATLDQVKSVCKNSQVTDFKAAKAEYESKYSIDQLLAM